VRLCRQAGFDPLRPLKEEQLCAVVILYTAAHKITTVAGFVSAISNYFHSHGFGALPRHNVYDAVRAGLDNFYGEFNSPQRKSAITIAQLCSVRRLLDLDVFEDARDWCAYLFAFFGLLRINEYANGGLAVHSVIAERWGIKLTIQFSKTSLIPTEVDLVRRDDLLCPLAAYKSYTKLITRVQLPRSPFFLAGSASSSPLTDSDLVSRFRSNIAAILPSSSDPATYAGHSFRRGGATAMFLAGVPEATIAAHGRWKSLAYREYFDGDNLRLRLLATAQLRVRFPV